MRLIYRYLLICGLLANAVAIGVFAHYKSTGLTTHRYLAKGVDFLDRDSSPTRHIAHFLRLGLLDSGLFSDPVGAYPPELTMELPRWLGIGASALRRDTAPRYSSDGQAIATTDHDLWVLTTTSTVRSVSVSSVAALENAIRNARPGDQIMLLPGRYRLKHSIELNTDGNPRKPVVLRGQHIASTVVELSGDARLVVNGSYWTISDLIVRGNCKPQSCAAFASSGPKAEALTLRNIFVSGVDTLIEPSQDRSPRIPILTDAITLVGTTLSAANLDVRQQSVRKIALPESKGGFITVCPEADDKQGCDTNSLSDAVDRLDDAGLILLRTGTYRQAAILGNPGLHLLAEPGARLFEESLRGKGALIVKANATIEGLECSHIRVPDGNGCCVRQERGDLTLIGVHFHHAQMGILTGHEGGNIRIFDSYFHDSGYDESGALGHNLYIGSGALEFIRSWSLSARNAGHELKSRAQNTVIENSLLASLNARDSRLIDAPDGGLLKISGSVLGEGPRSENWEVIGFGLEIREKAPKYPVNEIIVRNNTIYADRPQGARLLNAKHAGLIDFVDNVIIGNTTAPSGNTYYADREAASVRPYPALQTLLFD